MKQGKTRINTIEIYRIDSINVYITQSILIDLIIIKLISSNSLQTGTQLTQNLCVLKNDRNGFVCTDCVDDEFQLVVCPIYIERRRIRPVWHEKQHLCQGRS